METDYQSLANSYISNLVPYQPGKPIEELERELGIVSAIKLASNENALGASPKAMAAAQAAITNSHIYPDGGCYELKKALASYLDLQANQLTIGNGSENILEIIVKAYLGRGDKAVISQYAFLTIPLLIKSCGAEIIKVFARDFGHDIAGIIAAVTKDTRIVFIVNPNNPTGTYTTHDDLILLLESIPREVLVVVDEAYNEYIDRPDYPDTLKLLPKYPNIIVTRTFSKAFGLAALRIGFAAASPEISDMLNRARLPFNVNTIAAVAARAALDDQDHINRSVAMNTLGMRQVEAGLKKLNVSYIPSLGNFIALDVEKSAIEIYQKLLQLGVIVRPLTAYDMPTYLRVTIGTPDQNERFLKALEEVLA